MCAQKGRIYLKDLTIDFDDCKINIRVGAIIKNKNQILLCMIKNTDFWFVPGGRVKTLESTEEAIIRELNEEIGDNFKLLNSCIFSENFFIHNNIKFHEFCTYYFAHWKKEQIEIKPSKNEIFKWFDINEIENLNIKPGFIIKYLKRKYIKNGNYKEIYKDF